MHRYYMFDRGIMQPQGMSNLRILPCKAQKDFDHNPLFREDFFSDPPRKWEVRYDNSYPNVIYDPDESIYRLYYTLIVRDEVSESTSLAQRAGQNYVPLAGRVVAMAYAQSKDGVHWEKPSLGLVEFDGSTDNNIMMMYAHGTGVFRDAQEIDPARRYKLVTKLDYPGTTGHMAVSFSADGIHWSPLIAWPRYNPQADSHNFAFRDPADGKFKLITRVWKNGLRISAVCESTDFINWSEPKEILRGNGFGSQVYSMPVYCTAGIYIGFASMFHEGDREHARHAGKRPCDLCRAVAVTVCLDDRAQLRMRFCAEQARVFADMIEAYDRPVLLRYRTVCRIHNIIYMKRACDRCAERENSRKIIA